MNCSLPGSPSALLYSLFFLRQDRPDPGIEPMSPASPALQVDSLPLSQQEMPSLAKDKKRMFRVVVWDFKGEEGNSQGDGKTSI